jgi:subtilisin family serine protease
LNNKVGVMSVGATAQNGAGASFTNHGAWVEIAAPGVDVVSTYHEPTDPNPANMYVAVLGGTSMSAPHVCGVAALMESKNPALTRQNKFDLMRSTAVVDNEPTKLLGTGIVNANAAVAASGP